MANRCCVRPAPKLYSRALTAATISRLLEFKSLFFQVFGVKRDWNFNSLEEPCTVSTSDALRTVREGKGIPYFKLTSLLEPKQRTTSSVSVLRVHWRRKYSVGLKWVLSVEFRREFAVYFALNY